MDIALILDTVAAVRASRLACSATQELRLRGDTLLNRNFAALMSLAVVLSGALASSTESADAKNSKKNNHRAGNYFVPPPPPYTPSLVPTALGLTYAPAAEADGDYEVVEVPVNPYTKYIVKRNKVGTPHVAQTSPHVSYDRTEEIKVQKSIEDIDSEISNIQKDIGKLLNL